jgi:cyclopropane fatty-acyl-phospholipid synthase-like methyltransferase
MAIARIALMPAIRPTASSLPLLLHDGLKVSPRSRRKFREIESCRICGNRDLVPIVSMGEQYLTGVFPNTRGARLSKGPLELVSCNTVRNPNSCGLVQLRQTYDLREMYGDNYGYRSSLNRAMVKHLAQKVQQLITRYPLNPGDLVLDIGSNDGTLLSFYPEVDVTVVGIDPTAHKFARSYAGHICVIPDFFSAELFGNRFGKRKARIVTSIAMFYDLENPLSFMRDVASILGEDGVWHFEMSYLPALLRTMGYDTICHEHLEYYSLRQIKWMTDRCGLKILDVELNETNGGSFAITVARKSSKYPENAAQLRDLLAEEGTGVLRTADQQRIFRNAVETHREKLLALLHALKEQKRTVIGYGASTKGNVLLQHCGITPDLLPAIAEVNEDKFGCFTPGTNIPIISESDAHAMNPDYLLVLPWHFRDNLIQRERSFLQRGGKMIFPLPAIEIVGAEPLCQPH